MIKLALPRSSKAILHQIRHFATGSGVYMDRTGSKQDLKRLVRDLRPVRSHCPLIRVGPDGDGGYLIPDDLDGIEACISPGVSTECRFERQLAERGIRIFMADASVEGPPLAHPLFSFTPKFLDVYNDDTNITMDDFCNGVA